MSTVLVSGANRGLGAAIALGLAGAGHRVVAGSRSPAPEGFPLRVVPLDVTDEESVRAAVAAAGQVDVLVNNAAITAGGPVETTTDDRLRAVLETNVLGPLRLLRAVLPGMRERRSGAVVLIGSTQGALPAPGAGAYAASKAAAAALHDALALEVEQWDIRVATLELGPFRTGIAPPVDQLVDTGAYGDLIAALRTRSRRRLGEAGDPAEVAEAVLTVLGSEHPPLRLPVGRQARTDLDGERGRDAFLAGLRTDCWPPVQEEGSRR